MSEATEPKPCRACLGAGMVNFTPCPACVVRAELSEREDEIARQLTDAYVEQSNRLRADIERRLAQTREHLDADRDMRAKWVEEDRAYRAEIDSTRTSQIEEQLRVLERNNELLSRIAVALERMAVR